MARIIALVNLTVKTTFVFVFLFFFSWGQTTGGRILESVNSSSLSNDQRWLAQFGFSKKKNYHLVIWDLESSLPKFEKNDFNNSFKKVQFVQNDSLLWMLDFKGKIWQLSIADGEFRIVDTFKKSVREIYFSETKNRLYVEFQDGIINEYDQKTLELLHSVNTESFKAPMSDLNFMEFDPDSGIISISDPDNTQIRIYNYTDGSLKVKLDPALYSRYLQVQFEKGGNGIYLLDTLGSVHYFDWNDLSVPLATFQVDSEVRSFDVQDSMLIVKGAKKVFIYSIQSGLEILPVNYEFELGIGGFNLLKNGRGLNELNADVFEYIDLTQGKRVSLINDIERIEINHKGAEESSIRLVLPVGHNSDDIKVKISPNEKIAVTWESSVIKVWDLHSGSELIHHEFEGMSIKHVEFSGDNKFLAISSSDNVGYVLSIESGVITTEIYSPSHRNRDHASPHYYISSKGKELYGVFPDDHFSVWKLPEGDLIYDTICIFEKTKKQNISVPNMDVFNLDTSAMIWVEGEKINIGGSVLKVIDNPNSHLLAFLNKANQAVIYNPETKQKLGTCIGHENNVTDVIWSKDGQHLYTWSKYDQTICKFSLDGEKQFKTIKHNRHLNRVVLSEDEKILASICRDSLLRLWNAENGKLIKRITVREAPCPKNAGDCEDLKPIFRKGHRSILVQSNDGLREFSLDNYKEIAQFPSSYYDPIKDSILPIDPKRRSYENNEIGVELSKDRTIARLIRLQDSSVINQINFLGYDEKIESISYSPEQNSLKVCVPERYYELAFNDKLNQIGEGVILDTDKTNNGLPTKIAQIKGEKFQLIAPEAIEYELSEETSDGIIPALYFKLKDLKNDRITDSIQALGVYLMYNQKSLLKIRRALDDSVQNYFIDYHAISSKGKIQKAPFASLKTNDYVNEVLVLKNDSVLVHLVSSGKKDPLYVLSRKGHEIIMKDLTLETEWLHYLSQDGTSLMKFPLPPSLAGRLNDLSDLDLIEFNAKEKTLLFYNDSINNFEWIDLKTGTRKTDFFPSIEGFPFSLWPVLNRDKGFHGILFSHIPPVFDARQMKFLGMERYFMTMDNSSLTLWDIKSAESFTKMISVYPKLDYMSLPSWVYDDERNLLYITDDNAVACYDVNTSEKLFERVQLYDGNFLIRDKHFRYDGTLDARKNLYFVCGTEIINLDQVKDSLYVPNLTQRLINRENLDHLPKLSDLKLCGFNPQVNKLSNYEGYWYSIKPGKGGLSFAEIYIDGVLRDSVLPQEMVVENDALLLKVDNELIDRYSIKGETPFISILAKNAVSGIYSRDTGGMPLSTVLRKNNKTPHLYGLFIGVNDYMGESIDLKFASQDAIELKKMIDFTATELLNGDDTSRVHTYLMTVDKEGVHGSYPDRNNILSKLHEIEQLSKPEDILFVFFGGHGKVNDEKNLILLTAESSKNEIIGISMKELNDRLAKIPAGKRVLILDACYSGQAINQLGISEQLIAHRDLSDAERESQRIKQLDIATSKSGLAILSSSASDEKSLEIPEFQHGLMTFGLLSTGLQLNDGEFIKIEDWLKRSEELVLQIRKDQTPQRFTPVNYSIGIMDSTVKRIIQLREIPLVSVSNVYSENGIDELNFRKDITESFEFISGKNNLSNKFLFSKNPTESSYNLNVQYEQNKDRLTLKVSIDKAGKKVGESFVVSGEQSAGNDLMYELIEKTLESLSKFSGN